MKKKTKNIVFWLSLIVLIIDLATYFSAFKTVGIILFVATLLGIVISRE